MPEGLDRVLLVSRAYEYFPPFFQHDLDTKITIIVISKLALK